MYLDFIKLKNDYLLASHRSFAVGLAAASGGNISVRLPEPDRMLVKPSGITLGDAGEDNLLITDLQGKIVEGRCKPTKETLLHGGLYRTYSWIGGIVHLHPIHCMLVANCFNEMPLVTKQMKQISETPIPICKIKSLTVDELGMLIIYKLFEQKPKLSCFLLEEHGVVAMAGTVMEAEYIAELAEENARVFWEMSRQLNWNGGV